MRLETRNISFGYGRRRILSDVSLLIEGGHIASLIGRNGAGKTTLIRIIMGFLSPDGGSVLVDGKDAMMMKAEDRAKAIAYIPQYSSMVYRYTVLDSVLMGRAPHIGLFGHPGKDDMDKAAEALAMLGIEDLADRHCDELSGGERQLMMIARALAQDAGILILDEPTAGQDYRRYSAMMSFLSRVNRETGITILFVTHDLHLALEYTPRSIVLADGQLLCDAPISTIFSDEELLRSANLKVTSLFTLARKLGLEGSDVASFIETFIVEEKHRRGEAEAVVDEKVIQKDRPVVRKKEDGVKFLTKFFHFIFMSSPNADFPFLSSLFFWI